MRGTSTLSRRSAGAGLVCSGALIWCEERNDQRYVRSLEPPKDIEIPRSVGARANTEVLAIIERDHGGSTLGIVLGVNIDLERNAARSG